APRRYDGRIRLISSFMSWCQLQARLLVPSRLADFWNQPLTRSARPDACELSWPVKSPTGSEGAKESVPEKPFCEGACWVPRASVRAAAGGVEVWTVGAVIARLSVALLTPIQHLQGPLWV